MNQDTPTRIDRRKLDLGNDEMILYMNTYFKNHNLGPYSKWTTSLAQASRDSSS